MRTAIARASRAARFAPIALATAFVLGAAPVAAQELSTGAIRPAPMLITSREVATFRFNGGRQEGLPAEVTVIDRGGQLMATYRLPGQRDAQPMLVTLIDMDIILQAETDKGVLTLQLYRQNDPAASGAVTGRWTLGSRSGELRGRTK
jgi:hypothetical protein